ncbi:hypothetical protein TanjilG_12148 [Lupinus angustifolius]|uniref:Methyltransferase type 11 domain-containing protein n=1 Tax=Lupinus angustifolius TaxID=3871 RepID=A0A1J7HDQ7_LUPAN|nr:PREDICTED: uncharacterized protein LOC109325569 [Lupinus angustifolius]OIV98562.1 hypothetical protein TanjilG_12148 [Lupinus angustifolius]
MEPATGKHSSLRNVLIRLLLLAVFIFGVRFAYVITVAGTSCAVADFCFFSLPETLNLVISGVVTGTGPVVVERSVSGGYVLPENQTRKKWINGVRFYSSVFRELVSDGYLSTASKSLCVETPTGHAVLALKEIGVVDAVGISKKALKALVKPGEGHWIPFAGETFDFVFSVESMLVELVRPLEFASEIARTLKPEGFAVFHLTNPRDTYSFNSFLNLFNYCFKLVKSIDIDGFDYSIPNIREIVLKKECGSVNDQFHSVVNFEKLDSDYSNGYSDGDYSEKCSIPGYKKDLVRNAEPLILEEPLKPWLTLKRNVKNIKYLPSMVDINFKNRYFYVDVGARSYGSSIGSWFRKQYPKQNKTFHVYAIEADKTFHQEYGLKKGVTLVPYAAWVKNETLAFEIHRDPGEHVVVKGRGMGRIQPLQSSAGVFDGEVEKIQGFDFADWLKSMVSKNDFVVMKMDVEGTEFDLIPRLFETGAICLVDEIFLECHYNRWQRCCPGKRSTKYEKTYQQCLELFNSLRQSGVLVHQWF